MQNTNPGAMDIILLHYVHIILYNRSHASINKYYILMYLNTVVHRCSAKWKLSPVERLICYINITISYTN